MSKRYDTLLRLLLVGDTGVGKTCLICQYACKEFHENHITTIGVDFKMKVIDLDGKMVKMQIWDTAGQERFEAITKQFYSRAQGCILVYDICSRSSFESLAKWIFHVKRYARENTAVLIVGNKSDMNNKRQVPKATAQQIEEEWDPPIFMAPETYFTSTPTTRTDLWDERRKREFADENNLKFFETSAKDSNSLNQPFIEICREILRLERERPRSPSESNGRVDIMEVQVGLPSPVAGMLEGNNETTAYVKTGWKCCS